MPPIKLAFNPRSFFSSMGGSSPLWKKYRILQYVTNQLIIILRLLEIDYIFIADLTSPRLTWPDLTWPHKHHSHLQYHTHTNKHLHFNTHSPWHAHTHTHTLFSLSHPLSHYLPQTSLGWVTSVGYRCWEFLLFLYGWGRKAPHYEGWGCVKVCDQCTSTVILTVIASLVALLWVLCFIPKIKSVTRHKKALSTTHSFFHHIYIALFL